MPVMNTVIPAHRADEHDDSKTPQRFRGMSYHELNAMLNLDNAEGRIQFDADRQAALQYFLQHVNENTVFFHDLEEKLNYLVDHGYYEAEVLEKYGWISGEEEMSDRFVKDLAIEIYGYKKRFETFLGGFNFYTSYALKTLDGKRYLERFEDRVMMDALYLADGDRPLARQIAAEIITGRFQPATPTFLNAGQAARGELVSCFLVRLEDNMESITHAIASSLQLSKRGGAVALRLTNLRESSAPIKGIENQAAGVIPVMKLLEDSFSLRQPARSPPGRRRGLPPRPPPGHLQLLRHQA